MDLQEQSGETGGSHGTKAAVQLQCSSGHLNWGRSCGGCRTDSCRWSDCCRCENRGGCVRDNRYSDGALSASYWVRSGASVNGSRSWASDHCRADCDGNASQRACRGDSAWAFGDGKGSWCCDSVGAVVLDHSGWHWAVGCVSSAVDCGDHGRGRWGCGALGVS